jgi:negative regulator of flagellin synthesis FlgM
MRIENNPLASLQKIYEMQKKNPVNTGFKAGSKEDGVNLSAEARFFSTAQKALKGLPDPEKVNLEELKEAVKTGSYYVKDEVIAEKIIEDSILDKLI